MANLTLRELGVSLSVALALGLTLAGCARVPSTLASSGSGLAAENASPVAGAARRGDGLTGFGATDAAWAATHQADPRYAPGDAYDPTPGFGLDGQHDDRFFSVIHEGGRVVGFSMNEPAHATTQVAIGLVLQTLPADAVVLWTTTRPSCFLAEMGSTTLRKALGGPTAGEVFVEFDSDAAKSGQPYWDPRNVTEAIVMAAAISQPSAAPGC
jgi:hypothetical protein